MGLFQVSMCRCVCVCVFIYNNCRIHWSRIQICTAEGHHSPCVSKFFCVLIFSDHPRHINNSALCLKGLYFTSTIRSKVAQLCVITKVKLGTWSNTVVTITCRVGRSLLRLSGCKVRHASTWPLEAHKPKGSAPLWHTCHSISLYSTGYVYKNTHTHTQGLYWGWISSCLKPGLCGWRHLSKSLVYA